MKKLLTILPLLAALLASGFAHNAEAATEFADLICEQTSTTGTGTVTLTGAASNYLPFTGNVTTGTVVTYTIESGDGKLESGTGTYTDSASDTLTRTADYSSDGAGDGNKLSLTGTSTVCLGWIAASFEDGIADTDFNSLALTNDLAVTHGGTGQSTEAEALGEMTQALSENTTPDADADFLPLYDAGGDTGERVGVDTLTEPDVQEFTATGTWTKPAGKSANALVLVQVWGAGGGGGRETEDDGAGGGGGGGYVYQYMQLSDLAATEAVTIGSGGAAGASGGTDGATGGSTTVNTVTFGDVTAYGGGGGEGTTAAGGGGSGGGGWTEAGAIAADDGGDGGNNVGPGRYGSFADNYNPDLNRPGHGGLSDTSTRSSGQHGSGIAGGGGGGGQVTEGAAGGNAGAYTGAGGGAGACASDATQGTGGAAVWGGGGGGASVDASQGGSADEFGEGGQSIYGGAGGQGGDDATQTCAAGTQPGGGGGGATDAAACAGADGQVIIYVF